MNPGSSFQAGRHSQQPRANGSRMGLPLIVRCTLIGGSSRIARGYSQGCSFFWPLSSNQIRLIFIEFERRGPAYQRTVVANTHMSEGEGTVTQGNSFRFMMRSKPSLAAIPTAIEMSRKWL
jgi:hypothetical protein